MKVFYTLIIFFGIGITSTAQIVVYSKLESFSKSLKPPQFEIIGKVKDNLLIYQFDKTHFIKVYDDKMNQINTVNLSFLPNDIGGLKFLNHSNFCYVVWEKIMNKTIIYQYGKINNNGLLVGSVVSLDTIRLRTLSGMDFYSKMFNFVISEDKSKIAVSKIGLSKDTLEISSKVFDADFNILEKNTVKLANHDPDTNVFNDFLINNKGDIVYSFSNNLNGQLVNYFQIFVKKLNIKKLYATELPIDKIHLVNPTITIDNNKEEYLVNAFSIDTINNKKQIEGFYLAKVSFNQSDEAKNILYARRIPFTKFAKNDTDFDLFESKIFINKDSRVFMKKDGGYIVVTENNYRDHNPKPYTAYNNNYYPTSNNVLDMNIPFFRSFTKNELDEYLRIDVGQGSVTSQPSFVNPNIYYEPNISLPTNNASNSLSTPPINNNPYNRYNVSLKEGNKLIAIANINKDGVLQNDTIIEIPEMMKLKSQSVNFLGKFTTNFFTVLKAENNFNLIAFSKNLNNQLLLNRFKLSNKADNLEMNVIKTKSDHYFFDVMSAKQVSSNELIIPFFRSNKMGFAKIY